MPLSALREVEVDHTVSLAEMGPLLSFLAKEESLEPLGIERGEFEGKKMDPQLTDLTCPECRGTIWEISRGNSKDYRCRVGHTYSAKSMLATHFATQEKTLYAAVVALEEGASLARRLADQFDPEFAERLRAEANDRETQADTIRQLLKHRNSFDIG
jgi:two-component system chemotaxis response regulator CheB